MLTLFYRPLIGAAALAAAAGSAAAAPADTDSAAVAMADLDLATVAGRATLDRRLQGAAERLCRVDQAQTLAERREARGCLSHALTGARMHVAGLVERRMAALTGQPLDVSF